MKIVKNVLATLAITGMTLTMAPFNAFADGVTTARLFGSDRIGTAVAVADAGWATAYTAILASSDDADLIDVLLAAPLAGKTAPILLTDNNTLSSATQAELIKLGVTNVYVVGSISQLVIDQVNEINGVNTTVLEGADRIATATEISTKLINPQGTFVVGYGALADALSIASYAAANNYSILVANPDGTLPASESAYKGSTVYIIGGPTLVADIPGATRLFGADQFATNQAVLQALTYKYDHIYVANGTGTHLVDSLVASSLAAKSNSPIVLSDISGFYATTTSLQSKLASTLVVTALGGHTLVSDANVAEVTGTILPSTVWPGMWPGTSVADNVTPAVTEVTGVSLNYPTLSLTPGGATGPLVATVFPANATNQAVTWTTNNAAVATVVNGVVTPVGVGTAIISATTEDGAKVATSTVTITTVTSGSLGVASDLSGFNQYYPLLAGNAAPAATLTVAGSATALTTSSDPAKITTIYDPTMNASFVVAPFNSYPALSAVPSQGLTMNMSSDKHGVITNVDGYTLASNPTNVTVKLNSTGEVSVNNVQLWKAQSGYKVVGYMPGSISGSATLIEENLSTPINFIGVEIPVVGSSGTQVAAWTLPSTSLPGNFEEFLGFNVNSKGQLQPIVASYFANHNRLAPYSTSVSTLAAGVFTPIEVVQVYASDMGSEVAVITISNLLNSKTATVKTKFSSTGTGMSLITTNPYSVNEVLGGSQNITFIKHDQYGNPLAKQTIYLETGIPGLWITQVNGKTITGSVNMGTTSSPSMQNVNTPVPLFNLGALASAPAYSSVSVTGLTASDLNDNTFPIVVLTTGDDGTVSITLADGNVTYVADTGSTTLKNSYIVDPGTAISQQSFSLFSNSALTPVGFFQLNWDSPKASGIEIISLNQTTLSLTVGGAPAILVATVVPSIAANQVVTWASSNTNVTIATNGVVTPVSAGTATITATTRDGSKITTCTVTVAAP